MRYLRVLWMLPVLLFAQSAEAARISFATENCGTPPLLGLEFSVDVETDTLAVVGGAACPTNTSFIPGAVSDGGTPLYGTAINSIQFFIVSDVAPDLELDVESDFEADLTFQTVSGGFLLTANFLTAGNPIPVCTGDLLVTCIPDVQIGIHDLEDYLADTSFRVITVNDISVPEPTALMLLGVGMVGAALRRRRRASAAPARSSSAFDISHRT